VISLFGASVGDREELHLKLMRWFRRNRRYMLAGLVVVLMLSWTLLGTFSQLARRTRRAVGTTGGRSVSDVDLREADLTLRTASALGLLEPQALAVLQVAPSSPRAMAAEVSLVRDVRSFLFEKEERVDERAAWRFLVLLRQAEAVGVQVPPDEVTELLKLSPRLVGRQGFSEDTYNMFLSQYGYTKSEVNQALTELLKVATLVTLRRDTVLVSTAELWQAYSHSSEAVKVRFIEVDAAQFVPLVKATPEELRAFYTKHSSVVGDPAAGKIGYMAPERIRVEYAEAPMDKIMGEVKVEDKDIASYYEEDKKMFLVKVPEGEKEKAPEAEKKPEEAKADQPPAGYRYKTLDEARDEIRQELVRTKAKPQAEELVQKVMSELDAVSGRYVNEPLPLAQMARRHGLTYHVVRTADGRDLVSRRELESLMPQGAEVAAFAFEGTTSLDNPRSFTRGDKPLICQVLERRPAEQQPFEKVEKEVRHDYEMQAALERAAAFAEKLKESVAQAGLEKAAETMGARLANLLGTTGATEAGALAGAAGPARLTVQEAGPFSRTDREVPGIKEPVPAVVEKAFQLAGDEAGVAVEGPPVYRCYAMKVVERQPAPREEFAQGGAVARMFYLPRKQDEEVRQWMDGLLSAAHRIGRVEE
jgi:hypothetical protein